MPHREQIQNNNIQNPDHLLSQWRERRAHSVAKLLCYWGLPLTIIAAFADMIWSPISIVITDAILVAGCIVTLIWIRMPKRPEYYWLPLYVSFWISSLPTLWLTGGIVSPFFGISLVGFFVFGVVMDKKSHTLFYLTFSFLHLIVFLGIDYFYTLPTDFFAPVIFVAIVTAAIFTAIGICIDSLIRTEKKLSLEFSRHYKTINAAQAKLHMTDEELREAQSIAHIGTWRWDVKEDRVIWSDELHKILGVPKEKFDPSFKSNLQKLNSEERYHIHSLIQRSIVSGEDFVMENTRTNADGSKSYIYSRGRVIKDAKGNVIQMVGTSFNRSSENPKMEFIGVLIS